MRGLLNLNYIHIQFLSSKMRSAFDFIGLLNIFQLTVRKEALVASPESDPLLLLAIFQANHQCHDWMCLLRVHKVSVFQNPADGNVLENLTRLRHLNR